MALEDDAEAAWAVAMARAAGVPVNAVDRQELCDFITPAIVDRDPVVVAIGTEGTAPVLARQIKARLEAMLPAGLGGLARWAAGLRQRAAATVARRRRPAPVLGRIFDGPVARAYLAGDFAGAAELVERRLAGATAARGRVTLVGAGPGDPDLLTVKAVRALQEADVIVADRLVGAGDPGSSAPRRRRIMVGKTPGRPSTRQAEINAILIA